MMRALFTAVSGMTGNMLRLDVIGNNIANMQTTGFKSGRLDFEEALAQTRRCAAAPGDGRGGTNPFQIGGGSLIGSASQLYTQGSLQLTGGSTDLAVQGPGLFVLRDGARTRYTRDGAFQIDAAGRLVGSDGRFFVQGYGYDRVSQAFGSQLQDLQVPSDEIDPAQASGAIVFSGNLDADSDPVGSVLRTASFYGLGGERALAETRLIDLRASALGEGALLEVGDVLQMEAIVGGVEVAADFSVAQTTTLADLVSAIGGLLNQSRSGETLTASVDADGRVSALSPNALGLQAAIGSLEISTTGSDGTPRTQADAALAFTAVQEARAAASFEEQATVHDALGNTHTLRFTFTRVAGANEFTWRAEADEAGAVLAGETGRVTFGADGSLQAISFDAAGGRAPSGLSFAPAAEAGGPLTLTLSAGAPGGFEGLTMFAGEATLISDSDGHGAGDLVDFQIDEQGRLLASFSNGVTRPLGRIALAEFVNPAGLERVEGNTYLPSPNSGTPRVAAVGEGIASVISPGSLEQSNVDLAREFTDMIIAQRGFQANARMITTSNEVLSEAIDIKR
ncbi:MAG: flagellar hook protein FlgE [Candidatus Eisenbacteria bacterium]